MWKKILLVILVLSLALNVAFAAAWAVRTFVAGQRGRWSRGAGAAKEGEIWCPLHRRLGVTEEQWRNVEPYMREFLRKMEERQERVSEVRHEMLELLFAPDVDREAIEEQQDKVLKAFRQTQDLVLQHLLTEREYLTEEQERELKRTLEERMDTVGPGNPHIGSGVEAGSRGVGKAFRQLEKKDQGEQ